MHIIFISTVNIDLKLSRNSSAAASELCRKSEIYIYTMYIHNLYDTYSENAILSYTHR